MTKQFLKLDYFSTVPVLTRTQSIAHRSRVLWWTRSMWHWTR